MSSTPESIRARLNALYNALTQAHSTADTYPHSIRTASLNPENSPTNLVPIAAVLLEYPVAYVPDDAHAGPFLSNIDLDVFSCRLQQQKGTSEELAPGYIEHTFLQFTLVDT